jgi:fumarylacetoacetate (FAA) hydrolase
MQKAFDLPPIATDRALMYQGLSDRFLGPQEDVALPSEADGIDIEGEFGVILDAVALGCSPEAALGHVRLLVQINDWSLRAIAPVEMKTGFGWVQAKPACSMAPFALTPDELGTDWAGGRIALHMQSFINDICLGSVPGAEAMAHGFDELIAHAARTRALPAGTIIGSGTVSSPRHAEVGSSCLSERRAIEMIQNGAATTPFLKFGDQVRLQACRANDAHALFGVIDQRVVQAPRPVNPS